MKRVKYNNGGLQVKREYGSIAAANEGKNIRWLATVKGKGASASLRGTGKKAQAVDLKYTRNLKRGATVTGEVTVPTTKYGKPRYGLTISKRF